MWDRPRCAVTFPEAKSDLLGDSRSFPKMVVHDYEEVGRRAVPSISDSLGFLAFHKIFIYLG
jgi:hypothetical protein